MENILKCNVCGFDYSHLVACIDFVDDDCYRLKSVIVNNQYVIDNFKEIKYQYRSQNSIHLLFICEEGHFFHKSFDGHKGNIYVDNNTIMDELCRFLNDDRNENENYNMSFSFEILGKIESFFK